MNMNLNMNVFQNIELFLLLVSIRTWKINLKYIIKYYVKMYNLPNFKNIVTLCKIT